MRRDFRSRAHQLAVPFFILGLLGACGDGPTEPEQFDPVGTVSFTYDGARSGTFVASGVMEPPDSAVAAPVTGATAVRSEGLVSVVAFRSGTDDHGDLFFMNLGEVTGAGTLQLGVLDCDQASAATCRTGMFIPEVSLASLAEFDPLVIRDKAYVFSTGTVTVTAKTQLRIRGTFEGTAKQAVEDPLEGTLLISGSFDLPIRTQ